MAESVSGEAEMSGSWFGGWLQTAREKSTAAFDMVRKDLAEFGCVMQKDTGHAVDVTSHTLKESLKADNTSAAKEKITHGLNSFLDTISKALVVPPDDDGQVPIIAQQSDTYDRAKAQLHAIQVDPGTYLKEPSGSPETYDMWTEGFDLEEKKGEISELLVAKEQVRGLYTKLVPGRVSHVDFWRRYFYRLHQQAVEQARKEALVRRAERARADDSLSWDDDWSGDELAEDSGSDWEKLPRPNQRPSPPVSSPPPAEDQAPGSKQQDKSGAAAEFQEICLDKEHPEVCKDSASADQPCSKLATVAVTNPEEESKDTPAPDWQQKPDASDLPSVKEPDSEKVELAAEPVSRVEEKPVAAVKGKMHSVDQELSTPCEASPDVPLGEETSAVPTATEPAAPGCEDVSDSGEASPSQGVTGDASLPPSLGPSTPLPDSLTQTQDQPAPVPTETGEAQQTGAEAGAHLAQTDEKEQAAAKEAAATEATDVLDVDDDWEQDLDIELTEEDMKAAEDLAKSLGENIDLEDDWESWE